MRALALALLAAGLLLPDSASALALKPWIGMDGTWGNCTMTDMNREIGRLNAEFGGTALRLWEIKSGPSVGLSAGLDLGRGFSLGIGYDRLFSASGAEDPLHYLRFRFPANAVKAIAEYAFPTKGNLGARLGVAGGKVMENGAIVFPLEEAVTGTGPLFETWLGVDWLAQPRCALSLQVGYRSARIAKVKIGGVRAVNPDGSDFTLDYSGMMARLGFRFPLAAAPGTPGSTSATGIRPWLGADGSWARYFMSDVNRDIPDDELGMDEISSGLGLGASAGLDLSPGLGIGVGYERLFASSEAGSGSSLKYDLAANAYRAFVEYRLKSAGRLGGRLGIAGGTVMEAGSVEIGDESFDVTGSGPLIEAYATTEWQAAPHLAVVFSQCCRYARVGEVKADHAVLWNADGSRFSVDYSGIFLRLGLRVPFGK